MQYYVVFKCKNNICQEIYEAVYIKKRMYFYSDEESPVSLVKLHAIADKEDGWIQMVSSMVNIIPLEDPFGPTAISILLDDCPLPSRESVIKVSRFFINTTIKLH